MEFAYFQMLLTLIYGNISNSDYLNPAGEIITENDVNKVLEHAKAINLSPDRKILHVLSQNFKVDERDGIKDPVGLSGHRLEAKVHLVTISRNIEQDLINQICSLSLSSFPVPITLSSFPFLMT